MEADELMDDDLFADLYGDDEPSKSAQADQAKPASTSAPAPAPALAPVAVAPSAAPVKDNSLLAATYTQEATSIPAVAQKAVDPRAPPPPQPTAVNQQPTKVENNPYALEEEVDNYTGWDAAVSGVDGGVGGNDNGGYGGYGYDASGGAGAYGDGNASGSPAIKEDGKMFIGGLNWETTDESLKDYFSQYGEVIECTVMRDGPTGRSRGFGFLTFKDPKTVNIVMVKEHYLDGKIIDPKRAIPRDEQEKTSKIFVGGVSQEASETDFREFFTQFGRVLDATLMMDKDTGRPRGFGFVTFDSEGAVENALNCKTLEILGKPIEVKKAQPRGNIRERMNANFDERDEHRGGNFRDRNDRRDRFENRDGTNSGSGSYAGNGQQNQAAQSGQQGIYGGISPQMMAQYYQNVQRYMQAMQAFGRGAAGPMPIANPAMLQALGRGAMSSMNPAMLQQMQQMQQMQAQQQGQQGPMANVGSPGPPQQAGPQGGYGSPQPQMGYGGPQGPPQGGANYDGGGGASYHDMQQQQQQQVVQQQQQQNQYRQQRNNFQHHPSQRDYQPPQPQPSSWEGMYDDVPPQQQQQMMQQGARIGMNYIPRPGVPSPHNPNYHPSYQHNISSPGPNSFNDSSFDTMTPLSYHTIPSNYSSSPPSNFQTHMSSTKTCEVDHEYSSPGGGGAPYRQNGPGSDGPPPNAPTGPRNAKGSGSNYRGGGRGATATRASDRGGAAYGGGYRGGYHPYARNQNQGAERF